MMQRILNSFRPFRNHIEFRTSNETSSNVRSIFGAAFSTKRSLNTLAQQAKTHVAETPSKKEQLITQEVINKVNDHVKKGIEGRLFAVIYVCGKQFKVTPEDIIIVEGYWPPQNGDEIKMEKVMLVGSMDFTLIGRPILPQDLVTVTATVIEKDLSHTKTSFYKRRRKQYKRIHFYRSQMTMLRINEVSITGKVNDHNTIISQYERI